MKRQTMDEELAFLTQLLSGVQDAIIALDENLIFTYWNQIAEEVLGWKASEIIGKSGHEIFKQTETDRLFPEITETLDTSGFYNKKSYGRRKDGKLLFIDLHIKRIYDRSSNYKGITATFKDITDQIGYEDYLLKKEQEYLEIIDSSSDGSYIHDIEKGEMYYSEEWKKRLGIEDLTPAEAVSASVTHVHPDDRKRIQDIYRKAIQEQETKVRMEFRAKLKDGDYIWILGKAKIIYNEDGKPVKFFGTHTDITDRKKTEEALRESEKRQTFLLKLSDALRVLPDEKSIQETAASLLILYLGASQSSFTDYGEEYLTINGEVKSDNLSMKGKYKRSVFSAGIDILCSGRDLIYSDIFEYTEVPEELREIWISLNIRANLTVPIFKNGKLAATLSVRQTTPRIWSPDEAELVRETAERTWMAIERARAEEALRQSEVRFRRLFSNNMIPMAIWKKTGEIVDANEALLNLIGYTRAELEDNTMRWTGLTPREYNERDLHAVSEVEEKGFCLPYEKYYRHKSGRLIPIIVGGGSFDDQTGKNVLFVIDMTEHKRTEEALQKSEAQFRALVAASSNVVYRMSPNWDAMYHLEGKNFIPDTDSSNSTWIDKYIHPDDQSLVLETINEAIRTRSIFELVHRVAQVDGTLGWTFSRAIPLLGENGEIEEWIGAANDITTRKQNEEALLMSNEALGKALEMKDEFISLISHEFRTPLTVIIAAIQMLTTSCGKELSDKARGYFNIIRLNANRQLKLVNNILDIARINSGNLTIHSMNSDIVHLTKLIIESIRPYAERKNIEISFSFDSGKIVTGIDEEKFERVLLNLLSNAIKYTPRGKSVNIKIGRKKVNDKTVVCIQVCDEGIGIPSDKHEHIFERFGQVDSIMSRRSEGTGIGLHLTKMFVEMMGGEIILNSTLGEGSTFTVLLPVTRITGDKSEKISPVITDNRITQSTEIEFSDVYLK